MAVVISAQSGGTIEVSKSTLAQPYLGVMPLVSSSGNVANAVAVATLTPTATTCVYLSGFAITGAGATAEKVVPVTVGGIIGGNLAFTYAFVTGATKINEPLIVNFNPPLPASGVNVPIAVLCQASGAGGTSNAVVAWGFYSTLPANPVI